MTDKFERFSGTISTVSHNLHKLTTKVMEKYGIKGTHAVYLLTFYHHPEGMTAAQLVESCGKDKADVSRAVSAMEAQNLVSRSVGKGYRSTIKLTELGKKAAERIGSLADVAVRCADNGITEEELEIMYKALAIISDNMNRMIEEGMPSDTDEK